MLTPALAATSLRVICRESGIWCYGYHSVLLMQLESSLHQSLALWASITAPPQYCRVTLKSALVFPFRKALNPARRELKLGF
jgi:hypothetical protein